MVPCPPRQLVILSLPFAALVAFFWFKRRRSLSRSDPGGTAARQRPGDTNIEQPSSSQNGAVVKSTSQNGAVVKSTSQNDAVVKSQEEVKKTVAVEEQVAAKAIPQVDCSPEIKKKIVAIEEQVAAKTILQVDCSPEIKKKIVAVEEQVAAKAILQVDCSPEIKKKIVDIVKSVENTPVAEEKKTVCNGSIVHIKKEIKENQPSTPDFESNHIFHSTLIEEKDLEESKEFEVLLNRQEDICNKQEPSCVKLENTGLNCSAEETDKKEQGFDKTYTVPLEEQSTLEYIGSKKFKEPIEVSDKTYTNVTCCSSSDNSEKENVSVDTGLGSQDPSGEDANMVQGQKTEEKQAEDSAGLEQKLASLGLDTSQQPAQRERDSANHSPAEVMLNSPPISTFSDAHSEGSSDSGKGCSDVVTPPIRTPAGGSSVAGDLAPSVYEFVLPQVIVGRLIGRHGAFLHDIRAKTHTNVFIKKHPETNELKICAIEGTQQDIDAALKMIRQKFPLRRFPELTLEKVSFVKNSCLPINPENLQLHLVEGVNNDVILSSLITAGNFFLQMPMHMTYQSLYKLACIMNSVYNTQESPPLVEPQPNVVCVAPTHGGWYRAQIMSVDEESNSSEVKFLDYGGYMTVDNGCLRQIRGDFLLLPFQAVECVLANVTPAGGEETWSEEARQFVQVMTTNQTLQAQVYDYTDTGLPLVYLYCTQFYQSLTDPSGYETKVVLLNQELVSHGFADLIDSSQEDENVVTESS